MSHGDPSTAALTIELDRPIDPAASLRTFGRWGDDGLDRWDGATLVRTIRVDGAAIPYSARLTGGASTSALTVAVPASAASVSAHATRAIRATFVTGSAGVAELAAADLQVARLVALYPGLVPVLVPDPFTALIRSISAQQVNLRWAATVRRRLAGGYGTRHEVGDQHVYALEPAPLAAATIEEMRAVQLTTAKSKAVIDTARAAQAGELDAAELAAMDDESLIAHLTRLRGIGRWSAEWFLARTLGRPRVVAGDLGVRKAVGRLYLGGAMPSETEVRRLTEHWGAAATVVQALALHDLAVGAGTG